MKISQNFNRFYHVQIKELYIKSPTVLLIEGIGYLKIWGLSFDGFKQILKFVNLDYPRNENGYPISTRDISNAELVQHIEFIFKLAGQNGIEIDVIRQEWEILLRRCNV